MILSNVEIHKALDEGRLVIDPEPSPRKKGHEDNYCPYSTNAVDVSRHPQISVPKPGTFAYDLMERGSLADEIARHSTQHTLTENQPWRLEHGQFIIAWTLEKVQLPIKIGPPYLAARIEGKSSRSRCGVLVHFTAPIVHAGWRGRLTLEIINLCASTFILRPKMPIARH